MADVIRRGTGRRALALGRNDLAARPARPTSRATPGSTASTAPRRHGLGRVRPGAPAGRGRGRQPHRGADLGQLHARGAARRARTGRASGPPDWCSWRYRPRTGLLAAAGDPRRASRRPSWPSQLPAEPAPVERRSRRAPLRPRTGNDTTDPRVDLLSMPRRNSPRHDNLRRALAQEAARIMAEHGIHDFLTAKRKAAERLGVAEASALPRNTRDRGGAGRVPAAVRRRRARRTLSRAAAGGAARPCSSWRTSSRGWSGPCSAARRPRTRDVQLHLFADRPESVVLQLLDRGIAHEVTERRHRVDAERVRTLSGPALRARPSRNST